MALKVLAPYEQLILVGALYPVAIFAYKDQPVVKIPEGCEVSTLATVENDLLAAFGDLATAVGAPAQPAARQSRAKTSPPVGALTADAVGEILCVLLPENAILVDEGTTMASTIYHYTEGARAHDYLHAVCGGAIGGGLAKNCRNLM